MLLFVTITISCLLVYVYMHDHTLERPGDKYRPEFQERVAGKSSPLPILIWWTGRLFVRKEMSILKCGQAECAVTKKRRYLKDPRTRAMIFYGTEFDPEDVPLPREARHEWALLHEETPMNNYLLSHAQTLKYFNHSCTFRRESDLPITTHSLGSLEYLLERKPVDIKTKNVNRKAGFAPIVYVQSHCNVASDRDTYVRELMKHIKVDSYGACLHNKDLSEDIRDPVTAMVSEKFMELIGKYKFHIAFENAICDDYITEKLWRVFHVGSVPVYKGASTARDWSPDDHSIIMADDFKSPEDLARFIKELDEDDEKYEQYLEYKKLGIRNDNLKRAMNTRTWGLDSEFETFFIERFECHVCEKVNERLKAEKEGKPLPPRHIPYNHMGCPQPVPAIHGVSKVGGSRGMNWTSDYWSALDKSRAMEAMIVAGETDSKVFDKYWDEELRQKHRT